MPDRPYSAAADAAGNITLTVRPTGTEPWIVTQISPELLDGSAGQQSGGEIGTVRKNGYLVTPFVPQADAVGGDPSIEVQATDDLTIEWTGCLPGNIGRALVFWTLGKG